MSNKTATLPVVLDQWKTVVLFLPFSSKILVNYRIINKFKSSFSSFLSCSAQRYPFLRKTLGENDGINF